jgi:hypothetical protein
MSDRNSTSFHSIRFFECLKFPSLAVDFGLHLPRGPFQTRAE